VLHRLVLEVLFHRVSRSERLVLARSTARMIVSEKQIKSTRSFCNAGSRIVHVLAKS